MLKVLITYNNLPAIFNLPYSYRELLEHLLSAGFGDFNNNLFLMDNTDTDQVQVKLIPETVADVYLQSLFPEDSRLVTINIACELFYNLSTEKQAELINDITLGQITNEKDLLDAIKEIKAAEPFHDLPAIVFSRVKLWTDTGDECEFFMGGIPESYDDIEDHEDFEDFVQQITTTNTKEITAYITTFKEGDSKPQPAGKGDIDRIYSVIADVEIDVNKPRSRLSAEVPEWRNKRSVWSISTRPLRDAHFAAFPRALVEPCILAGCPLGGVVLVRSGQRKRGDYQQGDEKPDGYERIRQPEQKRSVPISAND